MIKTLIKHKITEFAINAFFKQVNNNFNVPKLDKFYINQKISCIITNIPSILYEHKLRWRWYYEVTVIQINPEYIIIQAKQINEIIVDDRYIDENNYTAIIATNRTCTVRIENIYNCEND